MMTTRRKTVPGLIALAASAAMVAFSSAGNAQAPRLIAPSAVDGGEPFSFADLVERVAPSVVSVLVEKRVEHPEVPDELRQFFQFRFRGQPDNGFGDENGDEETSEAQGSGFFIDAQGHIVTNNHVIEDATEIKVRLSNGKELDATLVGADSLTDLAVLKVAPPKGQAFVQFADDVTLRVGDWVLAVGNPFGLGGSVTSGIVSAIGGENRQGQFLDFIQIDAPINRGNSGGPTFDLKGRVVGVNTAIFSPNGGSVGIGFAIPAKSATETVASLIANGSVTRGWLGVSIQPVSDEIAAALGRKNTKGALVAEVLDGTPAAKSGIENGDLITSLNGRDIEDPRDLTRSISALPPGRKAKVSVLRNGALKSLTVRLGQRDEEAVVASNDAPSKNEESVVEESGLKVADLTDSIREKLRVPAGVKGAVVTGVKPGSAAARAGLQPGLVIIEADQKPVASAAAFSKRVAEAKAAGKDAMLLRLQAGEAKQFSALKLTKE